MDSAQYSTLVVSLVVPMVTQVRLSVRRGSIGWLVISSPRWFSFGSIDVIKTISVLVACHPQGTDFIGSVLENRLKVVDGLFYHPFPLTHTAPKQSGVAERGYLGRCHASTSGFFPMGPWYRSITRGVDMNVDCNQ